MRCAHNSLTKLNQIFDSMLERLKPEKKSKRTHQRLTNLLAVCEAYSFIVDISVVFPVVPLLPCERKTIICGNEMGNYCLIFKRSTKNHKHLFIDFYYTSLGNSYLTNSS